MKPSIRWGMILVLLVAAMLRLGALPELPLGLHYDEAANLILTREIAEGSRWPLFIRAYTGKEVFFFYAAAPWTAMTGGRLWGLRLGSAMMGTLTVAMTFATVRMLFGRRGVALMAAGWMAIAFPHVVLSRYGFRAISQPLLQALTLALVWRALRARTPFRRSHLVWLAAAGVALGLTGYTYLAARLFPIPLAIALGWLLWRTPAARQRERLGVLITILAVAAITFAPLGAYFLRHPDAFVTRINQVAAPSWSDALRGLRLCLEALIWPGQGDPYIRFNQPGLPVLNVVAALLSIIGLAALLSARRLNVVAAAGRVVILSGILIMLLPSALATGEITPSNLRMVGVYPFIAVLPAWGAWTVLRGLHSASLRWILLLGLVLIGGAHTAWRYGDWAGSQELFEAADGDMVLVADILNELDMAETTAYIASVHYRHPTVAALSPNYGKAKWLVGGATLVLPAEGRAVYLVPEALSPPAPWPASVTQAWASTDRPGPDGRPVLLVHTLTAEDVTNVRQALLRSDSAGAVADFAHIVHVYDARPALPCQVAAPCPILVLWKPQMPAPSVQPVLRLHHPETGEWVRTMAFHYASETWSSGDVVLDQMVLTPPAGTPPGDDYQVAVLFFDSSTSQPIVRLLDERFAGLEVRFPAPPAGIQLAPMEDPSVSDYVGSRCPGMPEGEPIFIDDLALLGIGGMPEREVLPGHDFELRLCWQAQRDGPALEGLRIILDGDPARALGEGTSHGDTLYEGDPAADYPFAAWREGEVVEGRYRVQLPKTLSEGTYSTVLTLGAHRVSLGEVRVQDWTRHFDVPEMAHEAGVTFGDKAEQLVRLVGYDTGLLTAGELFTVTLYWQTLQEMSDRYRIFVHLQSDEGNVVAQVDEMPQQNGYPTTLWMEDEVIVDPHTLSIPSDLEPGPYTLYVGLYLPITGRHLSTGETEAYALGKIQAAPR